VSLTGGANSDAIAVGDNFTGVPLTAVNNSIETAPDGTVGTSAPPFGPAGADTAYDGLFLNSGVQTAIPVEYYPPTDCNLPGIVNWQFGNRAVPIFYDGTNYVTYTVANTGSSGADDSIIFLSSPSPNSFVDCSNIVYNSGVLNNPTPLQLPGEPYPGLGEWTVQDVDTDSGRIFAAINQPFQGPYASGQYDAIYQLVGGQLVKIIGNLDTFPGDTFVTTQCSGTYAGEPENPLFGGFTVRGNWLVASLNGSTSINCATGANTYGSVLVAVNLTTHVIEKIVANGDVLDAGQTTIISQAWGVAGLSVTGSLANDGHFVFMAYAATNGGTTENVIYSTNLNALPTQATVAAEPSTQGYYQNVTLTATVATQSGSGGTPNGSVEFLDGTTVLNTQALDSTGAATLTLDSLTVGSHSITAMYAGAGPYSPSTSTATDVTITPGTTSLALSALQSTVLVSTPVTLTAQLSVTSEGGVPTGTVTFLDGSSTIAVATVSSGGAASVQWTPTLVGTHTISATYSGDPNFGGSTASSITATVTSPSLSPSTTTLTLSSQSSAAGQALTLTAKVTSATSVVPTGLVTFLDGATALGTGTLNAQGSTTLTVSTLALGTHLLSASYGGDQNFSPSQSASSTETIGTSDYTISATPSSATIKAGQSAQFTFLVTSLFGYDQPVALSCSNLPVGATCTFSPSSVTPTAAGTSASLTITTTASTAALSPLKLWGGTTGTVLACCLLLGIRKRRIACRLLMALALVCGMGLSGCGSSPSNNTSGPTAPSTPAGTDAITVTASAGSGSSSHTAQITVIVTP
jgi:uncharacterized protein YceK